MPICNENHMNGMKKPVKHFYIAGVCIHSSKVTSGFKTFLRQAFPYFHGETYEKSKVMQAKPVDHIRIPSLKDNCCIKVVSTMRSR